MKMSDLRVGLALVLIGVTGASSQVWGEAKYKRTGTKIDIKVKQTEKTKGIKEKPKSERQALPEVTSDQFMTIQVQSKAIREAEIEEYKMLLQETESDDPEYPNLLFRLAEKYAQLQRHWRLLAGEKMLEAGKAPKAKRSALEAKQREYEQKEQKTMVDAIKVYAALANNEKYKNFARMDEALFYYAYTLQESKKLDLARTVYKKLITEYPKSKHVPHAFLSFADFYFDSGKLSDAEKFYDKVLQFPDSTVYYYAMYKKGWVFLNQQRYEDAMKVFFDTATKTNGKDKFAPINRASKKDFVRAYSEIGKTEVAYKAFQRVDDKYALKMMGFLGDFYLEKGYGEKAIYTYRELIGIAPKDPDICNWEFNVVQVIMGFPDNARKAKEIETLDQLYVSGKEKGVLKGEKLQECRDNATGITEEQGKIWHQEAMKTLNWEYLSFAERMYDAYLKYFPETEQASEIQYWLAEATFTRAENEKNQRLAVEKFEKCGDAFTAVVKNGKPKERVNDSAYAAVVCFKNSRDNDPRANLKRVAISEKDEAKLPEPKPIDPADQKLIDAFDVYLKYVKNPPEKEMVDMKFFKARTYLFYDHLDEAVPLFRELIKDHPDHEVSVTSAHWVLDSLIRQRKYDELNKFADETMGNKALIDSNPELGERIASIRITSKRKLAQQLEQKKDYFACGDAYKDIYETNPNGDKMDEVLYNAGVCYESANAVGLAIGMYNKLQERFPKSSHAMKALVRSGNAYAAIARYRDAAGKYEEYTKKFGGEKDAPNSLNDALVYRKGIGDDKQAIDDIEYFVRQYKNKNKKDAADAHFGLLDIYEKQGNLDQVVKYLERYLREMGSTGGKDRIIMAHARMGQILWEKSCKEKGVDGACVRMERERAVKRRGKKKSAGQLRCGEASKIKATVLERDKRLVAEAQKHFRTAISAFEKGNLDLPGDDKEKASREAVATYWYAAAKFHLNEATYEDYLNVKFPENLDFSDGNKKKKDESIKKFTGWLDDKGKRGVKAESGYAEVMQVKGGAAAWAIAAAARRAQISQNFADALYTVEIPKDVRSGQFADEKIGAYCDALTEKATPFDEKSVTAFGFCLEESTKRNWFNKWSKLCENELGQIKPQDFPTAAEIHADPDSVAPVIDTHGLIATVKP